MSLIGKVIIGIFAASIATVSIFSYAVVQQYNDIKEIDYDLMSVNLQNLNIREARFAAELMINNPNKQVKITKIAIDFYIEDVCFTTYSEENKVIPEGSNPLTLYPLVLNYRQTGQAGITALNEAWQDDNNLASFAYRVHYDLEYIRGIKTTTLMKTPLKKFISDTITIDISENKDFEIPLLGRLRGAIEWICRITGWC